MLRLLDVCLRCERMHDDPNQQRKHRIPIVLSPEEVASVLSRMSGMPKLMAEIMYGSGLRVHECVTLRVKDIDFGTRTVTVRSSEGNKDRITVLPQALVSPLQQHMISSC